MKAQATQVSWAMAICSICDQVWSFIVIVFCLWTLTVRVGPGAIPADSHLTAAISTGVAKPLTLQHFWKLTAPVPVVFGSMWWFSASPSPVMWWPLTTVTKVSLSCAPHTWDLLLFHPYMRRLGSIHYHRILTGDINTSSESVATHLGDS